MNLFLIILFFGVGSCALAKAQSTINSIKQTQEILRSSKLTNGLSYFLLSQQKAKRSFKIGFIVKAGTYMEKPNQYGAAHVLEHMSVRSTANFPDVTLFLGTNGMEPGKGLVATTG
ncbi:MAG: hypothetical protein EOO43_14935, partial [Flavobacterium sp.]